jgi:NhaP-type Na+/H+ or K+/H+ antiporter
MIWSLSEAEKTASVISLIGPFTLIFLLAEVEPYVETPAFLMRSILSGLSFGAIIAFAAVYISNKTNPKIKNWISIGQIYAAYGFAALIGASAVAASLASVIVYVTVGLYINLWPSKRVEPTPLNTWPGFTFVLALFFLLGWEAHYPPSNLFILEIVIGFLISLAIAWIGQRLNLDAFPKNIPLWRIGRRVALLLFPALLIWPRDTLQQPLLIGYAFGIAMVNLVLAKITLDYFFTE